MKTSLILVIALVLFGAAVARKHSRQAATTTKTTTTTNGTAVNTTTTTNSTGNVTNTTTTTAQGTNGFVGPAPYSENLTKGLPDDPFYYYGSGDICWKLSDTCQYSAGNTTDATTKAQIADLCTFISTPPFINEKCPRLVDWARPCFKNCLTICNEQLAGAGAAWVACYINICSGCADQSVANYINVTNSTNKTLPEKVIYQVTACRNISTQCKSVVGNIKNGTVVKPKPAAKPKVVPAERSAATAKKDRANNKLRAWGQICNEIRQFETTCDKASAAKPACNTQAACDALVNDPPKWRLCVNKFFACVLEKTTLKRPTKAPSAQQGPAEEEVPAE